MPAIDKQNDYHKRIDQIDKAEKTTKEQLSFLSRELIEYITLNQSPDIATVNRLLTVLTSRTRQMTELFFTEFLTHVAEGKPGSIQFGKLDKRKKMNDEKVILVKSFLADKDNDIWAWAQGNLEDTATKPKDYANKITALVKKAIDDAKEGIEQEDVIKAVMAGGIGLKTMFALIDSIKYAEKQQTIETPQDNDNGEAKKKEAA